MYRPLEQVVWWAMDGGMWTKNGHARRGPGNDSSVSTCHSAVFGTHSALSADAHVAAARPTRRPVHHHVLEHHREETLCRLAVQLARGGCRKRHAVKHTPGHTPSNTHTVKVAKGRLRSTATVGNWRRKNAHVD